MAERALLSRSAFARQFSELVGVAPLTYLNDWRMALARERLRDTNARLAEIAGSLGYASEFSFAAAFKRHHGTAPGRWRSQARAQAHPHPAPIPAATAPDRTGRLPAPGPIPAATAP
jgi:AraC-like DNA-binding protein